MSSTNRGAVRNKDDFYSTPAWAVDSILNELWQDGTLPDGGKWLEPCAGNGAIIRAVNYHMVEYAPAWTAVELRGEECSGLAGLDIDTLWCPQDFLTWETEQRFDVGLTNVPFSLAEAFVEKATKLCEYFITLQRLNWLGSEERIAFWKRNPADHYPLPKRPKFVEGFNAKGKRLTGDSCEYAWFVFGPCCGNRYKILDVPPSHPSRIKLAAKLKKENWSGKKAKMEIGTLGRSI